MFWNYNSPCNINILLEKQDVTLQEIMDDDEVLQECKGQNSQLIEYLCKSEIIEELLDMIISEPNGSDLHDPTKYKYSNTACEILVSDITPLNEVLAETEVLRQKLFSFLDNEPPLNPLLASFFSKAVGILLTRKPEPMLDFIKVKEDFIGCVLGHLGTSAIMDLLLRLVTCVEEIPLRTQLQAWLNDSRLIERLIDLIKPSHSEDFHCNSSQALCDIIRLSRESMFNLQESAPEDCLLNTLEKEETVTLLLTNMFDFGINESVIVNGINVLLALLEVRRPAPFGSTEPAPDLTALDMERLSYGLSKALHVLSLRIEDFFQLLRNPPKNDVMDCTFGKLDPPLGNTRLHIVKLFSAILVTNTPSVNLQLAELKMFNILLDLFFCYEYNNFLHTQVVHCLQTVFCTANSIGPLVYHHEAETSAQERKEEEDGDNPRKVAPLLVHVFEDCRLIQRILDAWNDNRLHEENCGQRKGYMGHLTMITNQIIGTMQGGINSERIKAFIQEMAEDDQDRWQRFVAEQLAEINDKNSRLLGGHDPKQSPNDETDTDFNQYHSTTPQQAFNEYQLLQITSNFSDQFGLTESDYNETDDVDKFSKINQVDFDIKVDTNSDNQLQFEKFCNSRFPNITDTGGEDDDNYIFESVDDEEWVNEGAGSSPIFEKSTASDSRLRCESVGSNEDTEHGPLAVDDHSTSKTTETQEEMDTTPQNHVKEVEHNYQITSISPNEQSWFEDKPVVSTSNIEAANHWANFDNFESLVSKNLQKEDQVLPDRSSDYAVDSAMSTNQSDLIPQQESLSTQLEPNQSSSLENMEIIPPEIACDSMKDTDSCPLSQPILCTSADDVVMEIVDDTKPATIQCTPSIDMEIDCPSNPVDEENQNKNKEATEVKSEQKADVTGAPHAAVPSAPEVAVTGAPHAAVPSAPEVAVTGAPQAAVTSAPQAAVTSAPQAAVASAPQAVVTGALQAAVAGVPQAAVTSAPQAAVTGVPQAAVIGAPQAAVTGAPQAAVTGAPQAAVTGVPQAAVTGVPQAAVTGVPQAAVAGAPQAAVAGAPQSVEDTKESLVEIKEENITLSTSSLSSKEDSGEPFEPEAVSPVVTTETKQTTSSLPLSPLSPPSSSTLSKSGNVIKQEQPAAVAPSSVSCDVKDVEKVKEPE